MYDSCTHMAGMAAPLPDMLRLPAWATARSCCSISPQPDRSEKFYKKHDFNQFWLILLKDHINLYDFWARSLADTSRISLKLILTSKQPSKVKF